MLCSGKMSLWALALLVLTATARGLEFDAQRQLVNGSQILESFFSSINATNPFGATQVPSVGKQIFLPNIAVYNLDPKQRFTYTNEDRGYDAFLVTYLYPRLYEKYVAQTIEGHLQTNQLEYLTYLQNPDWELKYFLTPNDWFFAQSTCAGDGGSLYTFDHSVELDAIIANFYPALSPWIVAGTQRKPESDENSPFLCGYLKGDFDGNSVIWTDCHDMHPFVCQRSTRKSSRHDQTREGEGPLARTGQVYSSTPADRYALDQLGLFGVNIYHTYILEIQSYGYNAFESIVTYHPLEYLVYIEAPDRAVKYFLIKETYDTASATCIADGGILYSLDGHSKLLDMVMALFYPGLSPWVGMQKPSVDGGPNKCGVLHYDAHYSTTLKWEDCSVPHYFICERDVVPSNPPTAITITSTITSTKTSVSSTTITETSTTPTTIYSTVTSTTPTTITSTTTKTEPTTITSTTTTPTTIYSTVTSTTPTTITSTITKTKPTTITSTTTTPSTIYSTVTSTTPTTITSTRTKTVPTTITSATVTSTIVTATCTRTFTVRPTVTRPPRPNPGPDKPSVTVTILIDVLRSVASQMDNGHIRTELRNQPKVLLDKLISLEDKKDFIDERWTKMSGEYRLSFTTKLEQYTEEMKKLANDRTLLTKYFTELDGKQQLIVVKLDEMFRLMKSLIS